ncbi:hypothetical protein [Legionella pneumophila]|nr:hypothetical protein [Legionella pneumophila]HCC3237122.1 hypothetical protein [Legionella pneumophila subsp. pneumophila]HAT2016576.1 hypothetical protein [Legionella pneumophila]HAT4456159.1 hypothetical protein [Legionella pneumophila]HAU9855626.1 hypothetical protein [Legionella pneumophila]HAU9908998.1 hypothetical protein [Legionella pneumophila]
MNRWKSDETHRRLMLSHSHSLTLWLDVESGNPSGTFAVGKGSSSEL